MARNGEAVMKLLQGTDNKGLSQSLKNYLAPLLGNSGSGKERNAKTELHNLAKEYVPFLVRLLKVCGAKLGPVPAGDECGDHGNADEIFVAMAIAIEGLNHLRFMLTGSAYEIELQRYGLVRRLMAWKRYGEALSESQLLFRSLCQLSSFQESKTSTMNDGSSRRRIAVKSLPAQDEAVLCPPQQGELASGLPALVVAAVIDLIWCMAENLKESSACLQMAARLPEQLAPWISLLDAGAATKQRDALFKTLYKYSLIMVGDLRKFEARLVQQFCMLTLSHCAACTQRDEYPKVARKLCSSLSCQGSDGCSRTVEICTAAFEEIGSRNELQGAWSSDTFPELVDSFARSCQAINQVEHGWLQIYKLVDRVRQVVPDAPVVVVGLYAVGLVFLKADTDQSIPESRSKDLRRDGHQLPDLSNFKCTSEDVSYFDKASLLLNGAEEVIKVSLQLEQAPALRTISGNERLMFESHAKSDQSGKEVQVMGRTCVNAAKALHYVQKPFTRFVQGVWNTYSANPSEKELQCRPFTSALGKVLQLFYPVMEKGLKCSDLSDNEKSVFRKGLQMASQASLAALRLSLLLQDRLQETFELVSNTIQHLPPEEKWRFMSPTYNMGVQLFNVKEYGLACWPLDLAYTTAWAKVSISRSDIKCDATLNDMVSEACAKCLALVDAQNRNGEPGKSKFTLIDGLMQWGKAWADRNHIKVPHSLIRAFVKLMCADSNQLTCGKAEREKCSLYSFICCAQPPLPTGVVGLLLEEEHAVCEEIEEQYPEACHLLKEEIVECLLDKVYTGRNFTLEWSRVLMKKCRDARMHGAENLPSCLRLLSEAVTSLEAILGDQQKHSVYALHFGCLEKQLAIAYSMVAICSYETDPRCQEFLPTVELSLNLWRSTLKSCNGHGRSPEPEVSLVTSSYDEEPTVLLLYISDLLFIQGYSALFCQVQEVILNLITSTYSKRSSIEEEWVEFWMNGRVGHLLCAVPFPADCLANIVQSFGGTASPQEYWHRCFNLFPGSLLEAHHHSVQDFPDMDDAAKSNASVPEDIKKIVHARLADGQKSMKFTLHTAGLYHLISELAFLKGDTHEAIKHAKKALRLRVRLFQHVFRGSEKRASDLRSNSTSSTMATEGSKIRQMREHFGALATSSWPFSIKVQHYFSHPSRWRIMGDYIESLMQVGVIYERMGVVDEAEKSFQEGHRLALAQKLPMTLASFSSCLGEVHRKRQLWETAESYLIQAKEVFDELQSSTSCESCILTGRALLELRIGDLVRHCWCSQVEKLQLQSNVVCHDFAKNLTDALSNYTAAEAILSLLLTDCNTDSDVGTRTSGAKTRKLRLRNSVQTRSAVVTTCKVDNSAEDTDLSNLCERMGLTSLSSKVGDMSQAQNIESVFKFDPGRDGLRSEGGNAGVMLTPEGQAEIVDRLEDRSTITQRYPVVQKEWELIINTRVEGNASAIIQSGRCHRHWQSKMLGHPFFLCKWTLLGRKLLGRVLLQRGKCFAYLGEIDEAALIYQRATCVLGISCPGQLDDEPVERRFFSVEEGALLYHVTRLCLQRRQGGNESRHAGQDTRPDTDDVETCKVQSITRLYRAFSLCNQVPLLLHKIAKLLAILHVPPASGGPQTIWGHFSASEMSEVAAYFHQVSLGTTVRQLHLSVLDSKLDGAPVGYSQQSNPCLAKSRVEEMQRALRVAPVDVRDLAVQARKCLERFPRSPTCCISFVSMENVNILRGICLPSVEDSDVSIDWLLVTRLNIESKPVVVLLPIVPLLENPPYDVSRSKSLESSSTAYNLSDSDSDDEKHDKSTGELDGCPSVLNHMHKQKQTVLQRLAAEFGSILNESRLSTAATETVPTLEEKSIWWKWRMQLDARLAVLLGIIEDSWLGPFKCLLLGEPQNASSAKSFEFFTIHLLQMMSDMVSQRTHKGPMGIDHSFVKVLLQGVGSLTASQLEKAIAKMLGFGDYCSCDTYPNKCGSDCSACRWKINEAFKYEQISKVCNSFRAAYMMSTQASENDSVQCLTAEVSGNRRSRSRIEGKLGPKSTSADLFSQIVSEVSYFPDAPVKRQPLQLILDSDTQALPWESLPVLRHCEIYRMPSLGSVHAVYIQHQLDDISDELGTRGLRDAEVEQLEGKLLESLKPCSLSVPQEVTNAKLREEISINPCNTFYILNPNGDLPSTQAAFEDWFTHQTGWKGKAGTVPTAEEYQMGLQSHDLFVYLGHGSGDQFLPERYVRQLNHCAASLLMGCSSGRLSLRGEYQPVGVVLSYLMAGCPSIIANLWDVTDGDIDRFSRCLLHSWLASKAGAVTGDSIGIRDLRDCELAMEKGLNVDSTLQARHGSEISSGLLEKQTVFIARLENMHRMGSAIGQSRNACRLPHLIGASPVCYGVPTGVGKAD